MLTRLDWSSLTVAGPYLIRLVTSAVRCRLATRVTLRQLPSLISFVQLSLAFPSYFRSRRAQAFVWFCAKTDKGIVCLAHHLHSVTRLVFLFMCIHVCVCVCVCVCLRTCIYMAACGNVYVPMHMYVCVYV